MKAVTYSSFGDAEDVLKTEELAPIPPGPGDVVVDLAFSGVNPSDVKARAGSRPGVTKPPFPTIIPHSDGSGVISAVGDGVSAARIGERVWVWNGQWKRAFGTAATHITLPADQAVPLPRDVSLQTGAVLGIPGLTASHAVFSGGDPAEQTVLVHGGAGTVGFLAVQLAKWAGARVLSSASRDKFDLVRAAGAEAVFDYSDSNLAAHVLATNGGKPVDRIIDVEFGQNAETNAAVIAENGRIHAFGSARNMAPTLPFYPLMFKAVTLELILIYILPKPDRARAIEKLHQALAAKALICPVQDVFPLEQCATAHTCVQAGKRSGAILLETT